MNTLPLGARAALLRGCSRLRVSPLLRMSPSLALGAPAPPRRRLACVAAGSRNTAKEKPKPGRGSGSTGGAAKTTLRSKPPAWRPLRLGAAGEGARAMLLALGAGAWRPARSWGALRRGAGR
jgi:hypothetical protein